MRAPRGEFGHKKWPSGEDRPSRTDGRIVHLGHEAMAMGEVCVSVAAITGAAAEVDWGDDGGIDGRRRCVVGIGDVRLKTFLVPATSKTTSQDSMKRPVG